MHPLLTFSAGLVAGIAAFRLAKNQKTQAAASRGRETVAAGLESAQETLRGAAVAGLTAVEQSSAKLRTRLTAVHDEPAATTAAAEAPVEAPAKPRARRAAAAKSEKSELKPAARTAGKPAAKRGAAS